MMPLVTIITAAYNCEQFIKQAIESVQHQTYTEWELLIADDASTDATRAIIDQYAQKDERIIPHHNEVNGGIVRTRNKLLRQARGEYITVLDADDWIGAEKVQKQVAFLESRSFEAVGVNYYNVGVDGREVINTQGAFQECINSKHIYQLPFWLPSVMITRQLLEKVGGYPRFFEDKACFEDLYWIYQLLEETEIGFIKDPLYYYRHNPTSVTKTLNLKRLASKELVDELIRQRMQTGTDWLQEKDFTAAQAYMDQMLKDKTWVSTCYQVYAAIKLDENDLASANYLLKRALRLAPFRISNYRTLWYYLRRKL